jgi:hypothetical protein
MSANTDNKGALGRALLDTWTPGAKGTYRAVGWHAQISQLTAVKAGAQAAVAAGLVVKKRETLLAWLGRTREPTPENQRRIDHAYRILAGRVWNPRFETRKYKIHGVVDSGDRSEVRTLAIGEGDYEFAKWDRIKKEVESLNPDPKKIQEYFTDDVIVEDIGDTSPTWDFPGTSYTVT